MDLDSILVRKTRHCSSWGWECRGDCGCHRRAARVVARRVEGARATGIVQWRSASAVMAAAMERVEEGRSLRLGGAARCPSGEPRGERRACNGRPGRVDGVRKYRPGADGISNTVHPFGQF